ncbi:MAG: PatB family C-S lyase [Bacteroidales bacterium]
MKQYDFNRIIDRTQTNSVKTEALKDLYGTSDLIPLWVADMDFPTPDFILDAIRKRLDHPILGYPSVPESYYQTLIQWVSDKHNWKVKREWLSFIPGIVKGIGMVLQAFTQPGDKVIIQPPVYHPFRIIPEENGRIIVNNPLKKRNQGYEMDFTQLEEIIDEKCKVLILCNPHNPGGIVWDKDTLLKLAEICSKNNILVISDEIHSEMIHKGFTHFPFASVSECAANNSITFMAPSKTFNIAGIVSSYAIVPNEKIRTCFFDYLNANEFNYPSIFSIIATEAAYTEGEEWLKQLMCYLESNIQFVEDFMGKNIPQIRMIRPQASFLVWLDCRGLQLNHQQLISLFVDKARLALNDGESFGPGGAGFMRLNIATPHEVLKKALQQLEKAVNSSR